MYISSTTYRKFCVLLILSFSLLFIAGCKNNKPVTTSTPSPTASPKASSTPQPSPSATPGVSPTPTTTANTLSVAGLSIDKEIVNLLVGSSTTLTVAVEPAGATRKSIIWESSNDSVVNISASSDTTVTVTGKGTGTVLITAESEDGGKLAASIITVSDNTVDVTGLMLSKQEITMTVGSTLQIAATVSPENATNKKLTWSSSAPNVAMASEDGTITAIGIGTAVITVKSASGNKTATCTVRVKEAVTGVSVKPSAQSMKIGEKLALTVQISPSTADRPNLIWTSSNPAIASVSNGTISALGVGEAIITATTEDGKLSSSCTVYVSR